MDNYKLQIHRWCTVISVTVIQQSPINIFKKQKTVWHLPYNIAISKYIGGI